MTAQIKSGEKGAKGARRILRKEIDKALHSLQAGPVTDKKVHDARKRIKKARAALRLLRDALGKKTFTRTNAALRDVARPLSTLRDSKVLLDTLEKLGSSFPEECRELSFAGLHRELSRERRKLRQQTLQGARALKSEITSLRSVRSDASHWHLGGQDWSAVGGGLKRIYGQGRQALGAATDTAAPETFHEWRKQVKYLRYELEFLCPVWPGPLRELADQAHELADDLGDEHDLTVLRQKAQEHSAVLAADLPLVLALIDSRREQLRANAVSRGRQLYEEKPQAFVSRLHGYWSNWQAGG